MRLMRRYELLKRFNSTELDNDVSNSDALLVLVLQGEDLKRTVDVTAAGVAKGFGGDQDGKK